MTNQEIITKALIEENLFSKPQVENLILKYGCVPAKSFVEWQRLGYQVRKGEKAILKCFLWNPKTHKEFNNETNENDKKFEGSFYRRLTSLFLISQCERIQKS